MSQELSEAGKDRVFFVVGGASLPPQHDRSPCFFMRGADKLTLRALRELPPGDGPYHGYRESEYSVTVGQNIGTIDELVELYRKQLTAAAAMLMDSNVTMHADNAAALERAKKFGYRPGHAISMRLLSSTDPVLDDHYRECARQFPSKEVAAELDAATAAANAALKGDLGNG